MPTTTFVSRDPRDRALDDDLHLLLRLSARAVGEVLAAALSHDTVAAARVVRRDPVRHRAAREVHEAARRAAWGRGQDVRQLMPRLLLMEDVVDVNVVVDQIGREVVAGGSHGLRGTPRRLVAGLAVAGAARLVELSAQVDPTDRAVRRGPTARGQRLGVELMNLRRDLPVVTASPDGSAGLLAACGELSETVLLASRHAGAAGR